MTRLLPIAPFTETAGTFVNTEGRPQSFRGVVQPLGEARPGWKVLRVLGNLLGLPSFQYESADDVRAAALPEGSAPKLDNGINATKVHLSPAAGAIERIGEVPIYSADAIVRRARSLQKTRDAAPPAAWMNRALYDRLALSEGDFVRIKQGAGTAVVAAGIDDRVAANCVRLAASREETAGLGALFGTLLRLSDAGHVI